MSNELTSHRLAPDTCLAVPTYFQTGPNRRTVAVLGEVLWDVFDHLRTLGGAPLNFAAHVDRLGHYAFLISAVGTDPLGEEAAEAIEALGLTTRFLQKTSRFPTGTARVHMAPGDQTRFTIERPAAYDALTVSDRSCTARFARSRLAVPWHAVRVDSGGRGRSLPGGEGASGGYALLRSQSAAASRNSMDCLTPSKCSAAKEQAATAGKLSA
jgi:hypothetical protein